MQRTANDLVSRGAYLIALQRNKKELLSAFAWNIFQISCVQEVRQLTSVHCMDFIYFN